jgi:hypothetical protein
MKRTFIFIIIHSYIEFIAPTTKLILDARLAYRNKDDSENAWKHYASSMVERNLDCTIDKVRFYKYFYLYYYKKITVKCIRY